MIYNIKNSKDISASFLYLFFFAVHVFIFFYQVVETSKSVRRTKTIQTAEQEKSDHFDINYYVESEFMDLIYRDLMPEIINVALTKVLGFFMYFEFLCFLKILSNKLNCFSINKSIGGFFLYFIF